MIEVEGLRKSYGKVRALDGVDLSVPEGTVLGLLGPNGAGKTTIVRILTTPLQPDAGRANGLAEDHEKGIIDRLRSLPMARSAVLAGRTLSDLLRNLLVVVLMTVVGLLIGFRFDARAGAIVGGLALIVLFAFAFSFISAAVGLSVGNVEAAQSAGFVWVFPLTFASSAFVPIFAMPGWLQAFAKVNPVTVTVDAVRQLFLGQPAATRVWQTVAWMIAILVVFVPLSVWRYRKS